MRAHRNVFHQSDTIPAQEVEDSGKNPVISKDFTIEQYARYPLSNAN
jgi:hypothetical protein